MKPNSILSARTRSPALPPHAPRRACPITPARGLALACLCLAGLLAASGSRAQPAGGPPSPGGAEEFHYEWKLGGAGGIVAGLFIPRHGEGKLSYVPNGDGRIVSQLLITSEASEEGEYWRYGSEIEVDTGFSVEAWSDYRWRGETESERKPVEESGVHDIVAGIRALRLDPPTKTRHLEVWSDGKIYPVMVIPRDFEERQVGDRTVRVRHYDVRGFDVPDRRRWKGSMDLYLAQDARATPVEIRLVRSLAKLQLELVEMP